MPPHRAEWRALVALSGLVLMAFGSLFYAFSVLLTEEAAGAEYSTSLLSTAYAGAVLVGGGLAFVVGRRADRHGVRGLAALGAVLGALGLFGLAASREPWQVVAASWLLIGPAGALTFYEPAFVALDQWFVGAPRAKAIGVLAVVGGLAGPIYLPLTGWLVGAVGWRSAAVVIGAILAGYGLVMSWLFIPAGTATPESRQRERGGTARLLRDRRFVWYSASVIVSYGALQAMFFHRIAVFEAAGFAVGSVTAWAALSGLLGFPGRYGGPVLATRVRATTVSAVALGALAVAAALMVSPSRLGMVAHFVIFGLAFGTMLPLRPVIMGDWYSGAGYGRIMGTQWSAAAVAGALGPWLVGIGKDAAGSYDRPMATVAVAMAASAVFTLMAARVVRPVPD